MGMVSFKVAFQNVTVENDTIASRYLLRDKWDHVMSHGVSETTI